MDLSVVILNYNVKSFLEQAIRSTLAAMEGIDGELFVVDNASTDGSVEMVRDGFPQVTLIANTENVGFARGNNIALRKCQGRHILLLNPDTVVHRDSLRVMVDFMDQHPEAGAAGCKILNPDGTLQLACRRGFPTPGVAFFKIVGLSRLFPRSRLFGRYNLTYLDPEQTTEVDAISGSFMMVRREVLERVGLLDETYFMYGEDLDWFYRIRLAGYKIFYVPATEIVHFKGESSKRVPKTKHLVDFYRAMYLFVRKHHRRRYAFFPEWLLTLGIVLRGGISLILRLVEKYAIPLIDLVLVLIGFCLGILTRFGALRLPAPFESVRSHFIIYGTVSAIWLSAFVLVGLYGRKKYSASRAFLGVLLGFVSVTSVSFFRKDYAFSRLVAMYSLGYNALLIPGWRIWVDRLSKRRAGYWIGRKRTLIVGTQHEGLSFLRTVRDHPALGYDVVGFVDNDGQMRGRSLEGTGVVGLVEDLPDLVREYQVDEIIITTSTVPYSQILGISSKLNRPNVQFKLVPTSFKKMIGERALDASDDIPLIDIAYAPRRVWDRLAKRLSRGR
ncbi:MAG: glycosyltransferase [Candidatus Latescibacterota bacterium]